MVTFLSSSFPSFLSPSPSLQASITPPRLAVRVPEAATTAAALILEAVAATGPGGGWGLGGAPGAAAAGPAP